MIMRPALNKTALMGKQGRRTMHNVQDSNDLQATHIIYELNRYHNYTFQLTILSRIV